MFTFDCRYIITSNCRNFTEMTLTKRGRKLNLRTKIVEDDLKSLPYGAKVYETG